MLPPRLRQHVVLANVRGDTAVMVADSAAWATQLRYLQHAVLERLRERHDLPVRRLAVRIAPAREHPPPSTTAPVRLPASSARHLAALAEDEADPSLAAALRRLSSRKG